MVGFMELNRQAITKEFSDLHTLNFEFPSKFFHLSSQMVELDPSSMTNFMDCAHSRYFLLFSELDQVVRSLSSMGLGGSVWFTKSRYVYLKRSRGSSFFSFGRFSHERKEFTSALMP
ncbi:hypothetical protein ACH5RR_033778 [Cinchona calisaya]|uniref:Uncharacterized protein n=1 Tax=Cinchona calisaya TaxID=153742 RepID=A0ABD2Y8Z6_9GENT